MLIVFMNFMVLIIEATGYTNIVQEWMSTLAESNITYRVKKGSNAVYA